MQVVIQLVMKVDCRVLVTLEGYLTMLVETDLVYHLD